MMTKEAVAEVVAYCDENKISYKQRLSELGISEWSFYSAKRKYAPKQEEDNAGDFLQLIPGEMNVKITQALLDSLTEQAKASPRLRMNLDLRNSPSDGSQRMLNAIEPGSPLLIHRHRSTTETVVVLRGRLVWEYYDEVERRCTEAIEVSAGGPVCGLNIPAGQWHTVRALESGSVILEMKEGAYEALGEEDVLKL